MKDFFKNFYHKAYSEYFIIENGKKVIFLLLKRALYESNKFALLFWKHLSGDLLERGYPLNPHDNCIANKIINGMQFTLIWHVNHIE
jgi:hypothetical protein